MSEGELVPDLFDCPRVIDDPRVRPPHKYIRKARCVFCHELREDMLDIFLMTWMLRHTKICTKQPPDDRMRGAYRITETVVWL